jgi:Glucose-6-phosphate isomerase
MIGKWYRQLTGESLGKEQNREGKKVNAGITPIASVGSTDLHSMYQLYMGGPDDKLHTFVYTEENDRNIEVPRNPEYSRLVEDIQGKPLNQIMDAIFEGVNNSLKNTARPFNVVKIRDRSEKSIGALLQFKMMEMMYLGYLMNVNPFNQPSVEDYKDETREILKENGRNG